jgi:hypothetical protein
MDRQKLRVGFFPAGDEVAPLFYIRLSGRRPQAPQNFVTGRDPTLHGHLSDARRPRRWRVDRAFRAAADQENIGRMFKPHQSRQRS